MNDLMPIFEQARAFAGQHVPPELLARTAIASIVFLVAGIGLSVLGAKLARPAMTVAFALLGGLGGLLFAREAGYPGPIGGLIGAAMFATIVHLTFRIWVGVVAAFVLLSLTLGTFGYQRVVPHVAEFDGMATWSPVAGPSEFTLPTPEEQEAYRERSPQQWAQEFWAFVTAKDASVGHNGRLLGLGALAVGLFMGVVAVRWMLILSTSAVGTALVVSGVATLFSHLVPRSYQAFLDHPGLVGVGVGAFMVTSLILQTLLTRKAPSKREEAAAKS